MNSIKLGQIKKQWFRFYLSKINLSVQKEINLSNLLQINLNGIKLNKIIKLEIY